MAPSIQAVELKNMPWWWMDVAKLGRLLWAWRMSVSSADTWIGGGLREASMARVKNVSRNVSDLRPCAIDTYDTSLGQAVRIHALDVCDVPPKLVNARQSLQRDAQGERKDGSPEHGYRNDGKQGLLTGTLGLDMRESGSLT